MNCNSHVHLFSADHAPSAQLYYLLRGTLHGAARRYLPVLLRRPTKLEDIKRLDRALDQFADPWPLLFRILIESGQKLIDVERLLAMFKTISRATDDDLRQTFEVGSPATQRALLESLLRRTKMHRDAGRIRPFRDALCDIVAKLYASHQEGKKAHGPVSHDELWVAFMKSPGADQFKKVVVLSVNMDEGFFVEDLPGLSPVPELDFARQTEELEALTAKVNANGGDQIVPFLGIDPRGYSADSLYRLAPPSSVPSWLILVMPDECATSRKCATPHVNRVEASQ